MTAPDELPGMLQVAINVQKQVWPHTMDAREWATRFVEQYAKTPAIAADESTMLGWFANAIMAGYDTASIRAPDSTGLIDAEIVAIRDEHLPSQGEAFDCIAFARAIERRARNQPDSAPNWLADELRARVDRAMRNPSDENAIRLAALVTLHATAIVAALRNQPGGAVPREPTAAMIEIGAAEIPPYDGSDMAELDAKDVWIAMYDAATKAGEGET